MSYQSVGFLLFAAIVLAVYYLVPGRCQKYVLLAANVVFYAVAGLAYLPFLAVTMLVSFFAARAIGSVYAGEEERLTRCADMAEKKAVKAKSKAKAKKYLLLALGVAVVLLVICKYSRFVLNNVNLFVELPFLDTFQMIVPLGISFYTFMAIGYLLDIYWKRYTAEKSFVAYAVFLSYFPHVVQGPIDRYKDFRAQLPIDQKIRFCSDRIVKGAELAVWGLFKKLVIADRLDLFVSAIYDQYTKYTGVILILATVVYSIQIYADFSGCIDIVSGVSEMFGIKLKENFRHPYFSKTMPEFWRRWHISLGEWFKDYVYYPVSVSGFVRKVKKKPKKRERGEVMASCIPVIAVWLITGIWHGAAWKYVAWGLFHAALIVMSIVFAKTNQRILEKWHVKTDCFSWRLWQMTRTFILCGIGRVFFRAPSFTAALGIFGRMVSDVGLRFVTTDALVTYGLDLPNLCLAAVAVLVLWIVDMMQERMCLRDKLAEQQLVFRWAVILGGIFSVLIFGIYGPGYDASSFIYEQF